MNLKKFVAIDAREALKQVKETLGDDAVILSNRTIPGGVEMTAIPQKEINDLPSANLPSNQNQIQNQNRNQNQNQNQNQGSPNNQQSRNNQNYVIANRNITPNANPAAAVASANKNLSNNTVGKNINLNNAELNQILSNLKNKNSVVNNNININRQNSQQNQQNQQNQQQANQNQQNLQQNQNQNQNQNAAPPKSTINITDEDGLTPPTSDYTDLINTARSRIHQQKTAPNQAQNQNQNTPKIGGNPSGQTIGQAMPQSVAQILKNTASRLAGNANAGGFQQGGIIKNLTQSQLNQITQGLNQNQNQNQAAQNTQNYAPNNGLDKFSIPPNNPTLIPPSALRMDANTAARQAKINAMARPVVFPNKDEDDPILQPGVTVNAGIPKNGGFGGNTRKHSLLATASATKNLSALIQNGNQNLRNNQNQNSQNNSANSRGKYANDNINNALIPDEVIEEIKELRQIVEQHLVGFAWGEDAKREPMKNEMMRLMLDAGFSPQFAREILADLPSEIVEKEKAAMWVKGATDRCLNTSTPSDDIVDKGGVYALVGPTGVGKTTTTAKLAARCVLRHGPSKISLITTDSYRIGAHEQLRIYGRILGVSVNLAKDSQELQEILNELQNKHMVLIDTMGMSQKDKLVPELTKMLTNCHVKRILLLNSTSRGDTLDDVVRAYQGGGLAGCIMTKIDEAASLASALDVVIRNRLKLYYVSNGQRVPEDLHLPNRSYLLHRAFRERSDQSPHHFEGIEPALMVASTPLPISSEKNGESFLANIKKNLANKPKSATKENPEKNPEKKSEISRKSVQKAAPQNKSQQQQQQQRPPVKKSSYKEFTDELNDDDIYNDFNEENDNLNAIDNFDEYDDDDDDFVSSKSKSKSDSQSAEVRKNKLLAQQKQQLLQQQRRLMQQKKAAANAGSVRKKEPSFNTATKKVATRSRRDEDDDLYGDFLTDSNSNDDDLNLDYLDSLEDFDTFESNGKKVKK